MAGDFSEEAVRERQQPPSPSLRSGRIAGPAPLVGEPHAPAGCRAVGRIVTYLVGVLATPGLTGPALDAAATWWWADPLAGYILVSHAVHGAAPSSLTATDTGAHA